MGHPNPNKQVSILIGIEVDHTLKKHIKWWNDPHIPIVDVGVTCERCPIQNCAERMAEPLILQRSATRKKVEETLNKLTE
jgi:XRE family transcriptional regulator, fatty acid utilization regulator